MWVLWSLLLILILILILVLVLVLILVHDNSRADFTAPLLHHIHIPLHRPTTSPHPYSTPLTYLKQVPFSSRDNLLIPPPPPPSALHPLPSLPLHGATLPGDPHKAASCFSRSATSFSSSRRLLSFSFCSSLGTTSPLFTCVTMQEGGKGGVQSPGV